MSSVADVNKDIESQRAAVFGQNSATLQSNRKIGPVAGWFEQKRFKSRLYNNGGVPSFITRQILSKWL